MCPALVQNIQNLLSGQRDYRTRTKNTDHAFIIQKLIILLGNRSANDHHNVITAKLFQLPDNLRNQRFMASRQTGDAQNVYRSEEHTSELQSRFDLVCRLLLEKKKTIESKT